MVLSKMKGRKLSVIKISPSVHLLSVLLFSAHINWNASGMGQGHEANQSGQCSRDSRGWLPRNVPGCFIFTDLSGKSQRKPKQACRKGHKGFSCAKFANGVICLCSVRLVKLLNARETIQERPLNPQSHMLHRLTFGSLDVAHTSLFENCMKFCTAKEKDRIVYF